MIAASRITLAMAQAYPGRGIFASTPRIRSGEGGTFPGFLIALAEPGEMLGQKIAAGVEVPFTDMF